MSGGEKKSSPSVQKDVNPVFNFFCDFVQVAEEERIFIAVKDIGVWSCEALSGRVGPQVS